MKKAIIIFILIMFLIILVFGIYFFINKRNNVNNTDKNQEIYSTVYYFGLGSRRVKVDGDGNVYDDTEIENPRHQVNYKFVKTLTKDQLNSLKEKIRKNSAGEEIDDFIIQEVYGVKEFGNAGQY